MLPLLHLITTLPVVLLSIIKCSGSGKPEDSQKPSVDMSTKSTAPPGPSSTKKPSSKSSQSQSRCKTSNTKTPKTDPNTKGKTMVQKSTGQEDSKQSGKEPQKEEKPKRSNKETDSGVVEPTQKEGAGSKKGNTEGDTGTKTEGGDSGKLVRSQKGIDTMAAIWDHDFGDEKPESSRPPESSKF